MVVPTSSPGLTRRPLQLLVLALVGALLGAVSVAAPATAAGGGKRADRPFYVNPQGQGYRAAQADPTFAPIGSTPQAFWMTDTHMPVSKVQKIARQYATKAVKAKRTPLISVYAIPDRDCGGYSAGGFSAGDYKKWIKQMAKGLQGSGAVVVLEPDGLWLLGQCPDQGDRTGLISRATRQLTKAGTRVYIDAGHAGWHTPAEMADRLVAAGVSRAQGFAVDSASTVRTDIESSYAEAIGAALDARGVTGKTYVMDTSRNGGTASTDGADWCNPMFARLGAAPQWLHQGRLDAFIWLKNPGESDGTCNGGPAAGQWWPSYALLLMGLAC